MQEGTNVRFREKMGTTEAPRFGSTLTDHVVQPGDVGVYIRPFPDDAMPEGDWHWLYVEHKGKYFYVPSLSASFDVIE